jgi:hypothetical protein
MKLAKKSLADPTDSDVLEAVSRTSNGIAVMRFLAFRRQKLVSCGGKPAK